MLTTEKREHGKKDHLIHFDLIINTVSAKHDYNENI
jgi:hypothetical protein